VRVVAGEGEDERTPLAAAFTENQAGRLVNSRQFDGLTVPEAKRAIVDFLAARGAAKAVVNYRLHDWCISRQRYWGPPIPVIYCDACGVVPVPEQDLPVVLPDIDDFRPDDSGVSPLARHDEWYRVPCPACGGPGRRETDVSDTFLDSAWYFLRYPSVGRDDVPFDPTPTGKWLPVDSYIGGNEHAVLHLLYARFITMVLHDAGRLEFEEPFRRFRAHGHIIREGAKMSKTKGNIVNPDAYIERWGADTFRTYLMFLGPFEEGGDFRDSGIKGPRDFLGRLWASAVEMRTDGEPDAAVVRKLHQTIERVQSGLERLSFNTAVAAMMEYMNVLRARERTPHRAEVEPLVQLVAPFAPHIAEELWERFGHDRSIFESGWPAYDAAIAAEDTVRLAVQVNGKLRGTIEVPRDVTEAAALERAIAEPSISKFVPAAPRKVVFVAGRLLNIVV
jgi:leucyl-tRNA synthetase